MDIKHNPLLDQFFLNNQEIVKKIVDFAGLNSNDIVLEVGAGTGNLTAELAKKASRVIAFEIDPRFKPFLNKLPKNVEVHIQNAWEYIQLHGKFKKTKEYNKIVSNLPYSFAEQFLHNLTFLQYDKAILLVPIKLVDTISKNGIFSSFFQAKILLEVHKTDFFPIPRTNSAVIDLIKLPDPLENHDLGLFLRQYIYQHENQLVKNSLTEGLVKYFQCTKKEAKNKILDSKITEELINKRPNNPEIYWEITKCF